MDRRTFFQSALAAGTMSSLAIAAPELQENEIHAGELAISIAVPVWASGRQVIHATNAQWRFHVVLTNTSKNLIRLWAAKCAYGYDNLSFEILDQDGKVLTTIKKKPAQFKRSWVGVDELLPGDHMVIDVSFGDETWEGLPKPADVKKPAFHRMGAIYQSRVEPNATDQFIWPGKTISEIDRYEFIY